MRKFYAGCIVLLLSTLILQSCKKDSDSTSSVNIVIADNDGMKVGDYNIQLLKSGSVEVAYSKWITTHQGTQNVVIENVNSGNYDFILGSESQTKTNLSVQSGKKVTINCDCVFDYWRDNSTAWTAQIRTPIYKWSVKIDN